MEDDDPRMDPQLHGDVADFVCLEHEALVSVWFLVLIRQLETLKKKQPETGVFNGENGKLHRLGEQSIIVYTSSAPAFKKRTCSSP